MSDIAIKVENLGKSYQIGHNSVRGERYTALRDVIVHNAKNLARKTRDMFQGKPIVQGDEVEEFWALKDVSFEINQGDRVGIIGRNGAGKSTLLKILSRITEPTTGRIAINGRVASLLEVGTGFHPELTGRENIFLNGAILGMSRREIQRKFDEIVDFAEVEKFLDTPVKRYSSGMYVRLAFAVAAHLEPEILVVDEVLAVGDAQFQKKCLGKMEDVGKEGRTVLFVSHNIQAIDRLCSKAILLSSGEMSGIGDVGTVIKGYQMELLNHKVGKETRGQSSKNRRGNGQARFTGICLMDSNGSECFGFDMGESITCRLNYEVIEDLQDLYASIVLRGGSSSEVVTSFKYVVSSSAVSAGTKGSLIIEIPEISIRPGNYPLYFWLGDRNYQPYDVVDDLTLPLNVRLGSESKDKDLNPMSPIGFFSHPSNMLSSIMESRDAQ